MDLAESQEKVSSSSESTVFVVGLFMMYLSLTDEWVVILF